VSNEDFFPSEQVDEKAFNECFFRFKTLSPTVPEGMERNELAIRIAMEYYKEGFTERVVNLAELMYFKTSPMPSGATIQVKPKARPERVDKPSNPYSKYRI
jgi:hypothetical protein